MFYGHALGLRPGGRKTGTGCRARRDSFYRIRPQKREHTQNPDPSRACIRVPFPIKLTNALPTYGTVHSELMQSWMNTKKKGS